MPTKPSRAAEPKPTAGRRWALRDLLLAAQIALCCVTVTAAFVSLRGLGRAMTMDMGFNPKHAVLTKFELNQAGYSDEAADNFQRQLLERVSHLPGRAAAGYASTTPLSQDTAESDVFSQQATDFRPSNRAFGTFDYWVSPGYFAAAETPLLAGRDVNFSDTAKSPPSLSSIRNSPAASSIPTTQSAVISKTTPASKSRSSASWPTENTFH